MEHRTQLSPPINSGMWHTIRAGIDLSDLRLGDKINSYPKEVSWYDLHLHAIRAYQYAHLYESWRDTHTVTYVGDAGGRFSEPHIFEATWPRARYYPFRSYYRPDRYIYQVTRYRFANVETLEYHFQVFNAAEGYIYDVGALIDYVIQAILGYPPSEWHSWLDFGRQNTICSVIARAGEMRWWQACADIGKYPRPGGKIHVERTPPALFPDHTKTYSRCGPLLKKR